MTDRTFSGCRRVVKSVQLPQRGNCFVLLPLLILLHNAPAIAQIIPDATLSIAERSQVVGAPITEITGGATRGTNLFHSFEQFSIPTGSTAFFNAEVAITNIISRVTGQSLSNIDGIIRTNGSANLFLINPNGIVFGPNARLDVRGSFVATTANAIQFGNQGVFSASNAEAPALLTVNPSAFLFNAIAQGITNRSIGGLAVPTGKSLLLVGGNIQFDGGAIVAPDGRVDVAAIAGPGTIPLTVDGDSLELAGLELNALADITLTNTAVINGSGNQGGAIQLQGRQISLTEGSQISTLTVGSGTGGTLTVFGSESVVLNGFTTLPTGQQTPSGLFARTLSTGNGGNMTITTRRLSVEAGAAISTSTFAEGNAGSLTIRAAESVELSGFSEGEELVSGVSTQVESGASGKGGRLTIDTNQLTLRDGGQISVGTLPDSEGRGGSVVINASDILVIGESPEFGVYSAIFSDTQALGEAGEVTITTGDLSLQQGGTIFGGTSSSGRGGSITIHATNTVEVVGTSPTGASFLSIDTTGSGDAGRLTVNAATFSIREGGLVAARTSSNGAGGALEVNASRVEVIGTNPNGRRASSLSAQTRGTAAGGNLIVNTQELVVQGGGQITVSTFGPAQAGNLVVNAADFIDLSGQVQNGNQTSSGLFAQVNQSATGAGGTLTVNTRQLTVRDGARVSTSTLGTGDAGDLIITASDFIHVMGTAPTGRTSAITSQADGAGDAGSLTISTGELLVQGFGEIGVSSFGAGGAGDLEIEADMIRLDQGGLFAASRSGNGGNITLQVQDAILLRRNSQISARAGTAQAGGDGGNIRINAPLLVSVPLENSDITANAFSGKGGQVNITANSIISLVPRSRAELEQLLGTTDPTQLNPSLLSTNDITAISQVNPSLDGILSIQTPDLDPTRGLVELPIDLVDASRLIAQDVCQTSNSRSEFVVTGRGGLPDSPRETLTPEAVWEDWRVEDRGQGTGSRGMGESAVQAAGDGVQAAIVEAQGWIVDANGDILLTAEADASVLQGSWFTLPNCQARR